MTMTTHNSKQEDKPQEKEMQVVFFKKTPHPPQEPPPSISLDSKPQQKPLHQNFGWLKAFAFVVFMFYLLRVTEDYLLVIAVSSITLLFIRRKKIVSEIEEAVKQGGVRGVTGVVIGIIFEKIFLYTIGVSFLLLIITPFVCDFQNFIHAELLSKKVCATGVSNLSTSFEENRY